MINTRIHAILTEEEQNIIVTALDFFETYCTTLGQLDADDREQVRLAFLEYGRQHVSNLTSKIATLR